MTSMRRRAVPAIAAAAPLPRALASAAAILLIGCAAPPPAHEVPDGGPIQISDGDSRCFTIERAAPGGGLAIPRQLVCPLVRPDARKTD